MYLFLNKGFFNRLVIQCLDFFSRMKWQPTLALLPGKAREAWWATVQVVAELDTT